MKNDANWKLYLDDVRTPPDFSWVLARSVAEAMKLIRQHGLPVAISFDHDMGDQLPTGKDFLNTLVEQALDSHTMAALVQVRVVVHSANPVGRANIQGLWQSVVREFG